MTAAAKKKRTETKPGRPRKKKAWKRLMVRLELDQALALKAEANRRAAERGSLQPDASEVLRELVAAWIAKGR